MAFMDLSVKGKASPRHERPFSGKRSGYASRNTNTKANIFGISELSARDKSFKQDLTRAHSDGSVKSNSKYSMPNAPRGSGTKSISSAGIISQSELETTKQLIGTSSQTKKAESKVLEVNGKLYVDNPKRPRSRKAPEGVPKLQLGMLADRDDELKNPREDQTSKPDTSDSQTSVSWGTPINNHYYNHNQEETDYQVCMENVEERFSSHRQKPKGIPDLDLQLSHSGNEQFRKALRERNEREKEQLRKNKGSVNTSEPWMVQPQKDSEMMMKVADEKAKLRVTRKNEIIDEALVGDEMTRETVTNPQARSSLFHSPSVDARSKRHQALFNRNPTATTTISESLLSERLRFSARILSKNGHDAHRELNGFYFPADNTLTVYEFRQFGSRSSALPFIQRGKYYHAKGRTKDEPYSYQDIATGNDLVFDTSEQLSLPDNLKRKTHVTLRITDIDMETKQKIAFKDSHTPIGVVSPSHELLQRSTTKDEAKDKQITADVKALVRNQLRKRGVKTMTGLSRHFQSLDTTGDGTLDKDELKEALKQFNIQIPVEQFDEIWGIIDANHDGVLDYSEFTRNFIGEMNEKRKALVLKVYKKMDPSKRGVVPLVNLAKFYNARQHPHVISGKITEDEVRQQLLNTFEHCKKKGEVTYADFEDYFEGLSLTIDDDEEFIMIMRNCWAI